MNAPALTRGMKASLVLFLLAKSDVTNNTNGVGRQPACWERAVKRFSFFWGWVYL